MHIQFESCCLQSYIDGVSEDKQMSRNLVIYYSRRGQNYVSGRIENLAKGNCEYLAEDIQDAVGADLFHVETVVPYSKDYEECTREAARDLKENRKPELVAYPEDISGYDNIFLVGPCWWGTYPMALFAALDHLDFSGKHVFCCMSHEGSGMGHSISDCRKKLNGAIIGESLAVHGSSTQASREVVSAWAERCVNK